MLSLLASETSPLPPGDLSVNENRLEGLAQSSLDNFPKAEQALMEAERLCATTSYPSCVNVPLARGGLEMERGHFEEAELAFKNALRLGRSSQNRFVEANALLSLGWSALQQEHFDQAQDWSDAAYKLSLGINAGHIVQTALGNQGWAYYKLGEPEKALALFSEARDRAHQIGANTYEVKWLTNAGCVYLDAHEYDKAEQYYREALDLAQQTTKQDVLDALMSLALVSERTGKLEQARDYADKTIALAPADGNRLDILYPMLVKGHVAARLHDTAAGRKDVSRD